MAKTYTTVADKSVGDVFTEAMWDDYIKTNVNNLIVPPSCRVYKAAAQSINSGSDTAIQFDSERWDTDSMHDTVTNKTRITANTAGIYVITGHAMFAANATGIRAIYIRLNGSTRIAQQLMPSNSAGTDTALSVATVYELAAADYVELMAVQTSGGALNVLQGGNYTPEFGAMWQGKSS